MLNFTYHNPTKIVFGKGTIAQLADLIPAGRRILMTYGGGSIKKNGVYEQVLRALDGRSVVEFGGIEPNPLYETLMKAVALARETGSDFLLAVGGGSVLDGTKFVAAAIPYDAGDPWDILDKEAPVRRAVPMGTVLTLPATGSEMNSVGVISRASTREKLPFGSPHTFPVFSILDPETTASLPARQVSNGIVDAYAHVLEQYLTYPAGGAVQDRHAEGILLTLIEEGPKTLRDPADYEARANLVWCATLALNNLIGCGVPSDWATHMIGHELTALYGIDHAQSLAVVYPALLKHRQRHKWQKLLQYGERVWGLRAGDEELRVSAAIDLTARFFRSVGVPTTLMEYGIGPEAAGAVAGRLAKRGKVYGERQDIGPAEIEAILSLC
jgi:NADP-dependent alcohol dehydrogenase